MLRSDIRYNGGVPQAPALQEDAPGRLTVEKLAYLGIFMLGASSVLAAACYAFHTVLSWPARPRADVETYAETQSPGPIEGTHP